MQNSAQLRIATNGLERERERKRKRKRGLFPSDGVHSANENKQKFAGTNTNINIQKW